MKFRLEYYHDMKTIFIYYVIAVLLIFFNFVISDNGYLNRYCTNSNDCGEFGYFCSINRTCQCDRSYIPNRTREICIGGIGQRCKYDEHCIEGAFCEHQTKCKCKDSLYADNNGLVCSSISPIVVVSGLPLYFLSFIITNLSTVWI